jgi:hypothetical protein
MKVNWIEYKGKRIIFSDYRGLNNEEMIDQFNYETNIILGEKDVLYLGDFSNSNIGPDFVKLVNETGKKTKNMVKKSAIIGITGLQPILMNLFKEITGFKIKSFNEITKAKEYLIKD